MVEDNIPTRELIVDWLTRNGYTVRFAEDGAQATEQVQSSLPNLVVLDLILPEVNGFGLIAEWRRSASMASLPIVVLTNKELTAEEGDYLAANTRALLSKDEHWRGDLFDRSRG